MSEVPNVQSPQTILDLVARPYKKRDEILEASDRLVNYSYSLQNCTESELEGLQSNIYKEVNKIISNVNELSPLLENPGIVGLIAEIEMMLSSVLEHLTLDPESKTFPAHIIRTLLCPTANGTRLRLTPKTIKRAFGITVSPRDIKLLFEHQRDNY
jgi:hypothetical protein